MKRLHIIAILFPSGCFRFLIEHSLSKICKLYKGYLSAVLLFMSSKSNNSKSVTGIGL